MYKSKRIYYPLFMKRPFLSVVDAREIILRKEKKNHAYFVIIKKKDEYRNITLWFLRIVCFRESSSCIITNSLRKIKDYIYMGCSYDHYAMVIIKYRNARCVLILLCFVRVCGIRDKRICEKVDDIFKR